MKKYIYKIKKKKFFYTYNTDKKKNKITYKFYFKIKFEI